MIDHEVYFDSVRKTLFPGGMSQSQVDGQKAILTGWDKYLDGQDLRFLAYMLATTYHETAQEMTPIEEYHGADQPYGQIDDETGQRYYGRGFVQLTHRENYARADSEGGWIGDDSCEWHADNALDLHKAARIMWFGMSEGWFRPPNDLSMYFGGGADDPYNAREIINGDKKTVPSWSGGDSIGKLIEGYHDKFLDAIETAYVAVPEPEPEPESNVVTFYVPAGATEIRLVLSEKEI